MNKSNTAEQMRNGMFGLIYTDKPIKSPNRRSNVLFMTFAVGIPTMVVTCLALLF